MAFTLSGTIITQTGTDTNLSGLSGISGVTTLQSSASGTHTTYDIGTLRLLIQGNVSINPKIENLYSSNTASKVSGSVQVQSTGTLNLGVKQTSGSAVKYSDGTVMTFTQYSGNQFRAPCIYVNGGILNWFGGTIFIRSPFLIADGSTINIEAGSIYNNHTDYVQFRFESTGAASDSLFNLTNLVLDGDSPIAFFTLSGFNTFAPILRNGYFQNFTVNQPDQIFVNWSNLNNFNAEDILGNSTGANNSKAVFRNVGKDIVIGENVASRDGYFRQQRAVSISPINTDASPVLDFSYYAVDSDSGNRFTSYTGENNLSDIVYTGSETDGRLDENVVAVIGQVFNGAISYDDRRNASGTVPFALISYKNLITNVTPDLVGLEIFSQRPFMLFDTSITETTKATVDAYTTLDNVQEFYDTAKSYLVDNFAGEAETIVTRSGDTIDAGSYNLTIDATAASVFAFDGTTITIKASTFTGNITTTGTVTLNNGSTVSGGIIDSNGDSFLTFAGVDSWKVYSNQNDANLEQNELGSGLGSEIFRFTFVGSTTYFIRLTVGEDTLFKTSTPTESGETVVELTIAGLLTSLPANVDKAVTSSVDGIDLPATIASGVEAAILNDSDGQAVITAIVNAIGNTNVDEVALVAAIRADMERSGGSLDTILADTNELQTNQGDWTTATSVDLNDNAITSTVVANNSFSDLSFTTGHYNRINLEVDDALADYDAPTKAELDIAETNIIDALPDVSGLSTFDPATDTVANVTLVDTTTTNIDMRGTDGANTVAPDNSGITDILTHTADLQANQGNWLTATSVDLNNGAITSSVVANSALNNSSFTTGYFNSINSEVDTALSDYDAPTKAELDAAQASIEVDISNLNDITTGDIVSDLKPDLTIINEGVKKSSLIIPHATDLT